MSYLALKSVNVPFADCFNSVENLERLQHMFLQVFWESYSRLPEAGKNELAKYSRLEGLVVEEFPQRGDYQEVIDTLDNIYFDADEVGDQEKSDLFFRLARFVSAIHFYYQTGAEDRYMSAVYEALFSSDDAKKFALEMVSRLA